LEFSNQLLFFRFLPVSVPALKIDTTIIKKKRICIAELAFQYPKKFMNTRMTNKRAVTMVIERRTLRDILFPPYICKIYL
jgi:hypothetical protein